MAARLRNVAPFDANLLPRCRAERQACARGIASNIEGAVLADTGGAGLEPERRSVEKFGQPTLWACQARQSLAKDSAIYFISEDSISIDGQPLAASMSHVPCGWMSLQAQDEHDLIPLFGGRGVGRGS